MPVAKLKIEEVEATLRASEVLQFVSWASPLISRAKPILEKIKVGIKVRGAYQTNPLRTDEVGILFEVRFAEALHLAGLKAQYEYNSSVGATSIDFLINTSPPCLVELVSLGESDAVKEARWKNGPYFGFSLISPNENSRKNKKKLKQSPEGEMIRAQERIAEKVFKLKTNQPIKFPESNEKINILLVDARGYLGLPGDEIDWCQFMLGPRGLPPGTVLFWTNEKTGKKEPIAGLFEPRCPIAAAKTFQERINFVGFICETTFEAGEIFKQSFFVQNPHLPCNWKIPPFFCQKTLD